MSLIILQRSGLLFAKPLVSQILAPLDLYPRAVQSGVCGTSVMAQTSLNKLDGQYTSSAQPGQGSVLDQRKVPLDHFLVEGLACAGHTLTSLLGRLTSPPLGAAG